MNKLIDEFTNQVSSALEWEEIAVDAENQKSNRQRISSVGQFINDLKVSQFPWLLYFHSLCISLELLIMNAIFFNLVVV